MSLEAESINQDESAEDRDGPTVVEGGATASTDNDLAVQPFRARRSLHPSAMKRNADNSVVGDERGEKSLRKSLDEGWIQAAAPLQIVDRQPGTGLKDPEVDSLEGERTLTHQDFMDMFERQQALQSKMMTDMMREAMISMAQMFAGGKGVAPAASPGTPSASGAAAEPPAP